MPKKLTENLLFDTIKLSSFLLIGVLFLESYFVSHTFYHQKLLSVILVFFVATSLTYLIVSRRLKIKWTTRLSQIVLILIVIYSVGSLTGVAILKHKKFKEKGQDVNHVDFDYSALQPPPLSVEDLTKN